MMSTIELEQNLLRLGVSQTEVAQLLGVAPRTVRRWLEGEKIPGSAEQALRAWLRLHDRRLPWRPDSASILEENEDQIARHRKHAVELDEMLTRVDARGGPRTPWKVNLDQSLATLGPLQVSFNQLLNGGFSLGTYTRKDGDPDVERDWELIEDAAACIAKELTSSAVTLAYHSRPWRSGIVEQTLEPLPSKEAAIQRAYEAMGLPGFHDPFIMASDGSDVVMDKLALRRECERRKACVAALAAVADYVRRNSSLFVTQGPRMLTRALAEQKRQRIESIAEKIASLAGTVKQGAATYGDFEALLGNLHKLGFFPETSLVAAVARAFT